MESSAPNGTSPAIGVARKRSWSRPSGGRSMAALSRSWSRSWSRSESGDEEAGASRPELRRWTSHVDMNKVMETLRRGNIDLEEEAACARNCWNERETQTHFPLGSTRHLEEVPLGAIYATIVISWNAVVMLVAEVVIEILVVVELYPKLPFRLSFFVLTVLSGLLGAQTLIAVNREEFDTSRNALIVSLVVEIGLIAGDLEFLFTKSSTYPAAIPTRAPFLVLTLVNVGLVLYLICRLRLYESRTSHDLPECVKPVELGLGTIWELQRSILPPTRRDAWTLHDLGKAVVQHLNEEAKVTRSPSRLSRLSASHFPLDKSIDESAEALVDAAEPHDPSSQTTQPASPHLAADDDDGRRHPSRLEPTRDPSQAHQPARAVSRSTSTQVDV